jgi:hypothetical protein
MKPPILSRRGFEMCQWEGPVRKTFRNNLLAVWASLTLLLFILYWIGGDTDILLGGAVVYLFIFIMTLIMIFISPASYYQMVSDHVFSRWDKDFVALRMAKALQNKGINVVMKYEGQKVIFPLPPRNIIVAAGLKRTRVFVGPVTGDDREKVERLKAFVDAALGKSG